MIISFIPFPPPKRGKLSFKLPFIHIFPIGILAWQSSLHSVPLSLKYSPPAPLYFVKRGADVMVIHLTSKLADSFYNLKIKMFRLFHCALFRKKCAIFLSFISEFWYGDLPSLRSREGKGVSLSRPLCGLWEVMMCIKITFKRRTCLTLAWDSKKKDVRCAHPF